MAIPLGRKQCQCSPDCTRTLREGSSWSYYRGHAPKRQFPAIPRGSKTKQVKSFVRESSATYAVSVAALKRELGLVTAEIERIEDQAIAAERTASAARDAIANATDRHELLSKLIDGLEDLIGITKPKEVAE
jgi:hypothetical protein